MIRIAIALALAGCGRLNFDETGQPLGSCDGFEPALGLPGLYFAEPAPKSWTNARISCFERGGDLAFPRDADEALVMATLVDNAGGMSSWIGVHDLDVENSFVNLSGQPQTFLPWKSLEPNGGTLENCVRLNDDGTFIDDGCFDGRASICVCE
jgi:hypothetical protein